MLTNIRASTATIVRIPYVKDLKNMADFLYATTDVAIWSTSETGIGITASSIATLRPLFRTFFLRSKLMGGTSSQDGSSPWPLSGGARHGYVRSGSARKDEEFQFALRTDIKKDAGITTVIGTDGDLERQTEKTGRSKRTSMGASSPPTAWNSSQSGLTQISSGDDEGIWDSGIRKTTISSRVSH